MHASSDILSLRSSLDTLLMGPRAAFGAGARFALRTEDEVRRHLVRLGRQAGAMGSLRRHALIWGFDQESPTCVGDQALIDRLAAASARGRLAAVLLPDQTATAILAPDLAAAQRALAAPPGRAAGPARLQVASMPLEARLVEVLRRTRPRLPAQMRDEFAKILEPATLAITVAVLAVWAGSHAVGVGFAVDAVLVGVGLVLVGAAVFEAASLLKDFLKVVWSARTEADLDRAADLLARVIAFIGVAVFIAAVTRGASRVSAPARRPAGGVGPAPRAAPPPPRRVESRPPARGGAPERPATGYLGRSGFEMRNAPYQRMRNAPAEIGGRPFSGHALDQMQNRGILPSVVDNTIRTGSTFPTRPGTIGYFDPVNGVRVITNSQTGQVVTVIRGAPR